ncbi:helix-turn-helix domain-containing protein [Neisseria wadsworthii]|uniref:helix-turn-helix domain-containing protein n=1 Tax=Neisseria wadsworthii TaxID=607711 RepID=UPI000D327912|nr:helix-turn-helix domain-containing protein [Neisseria wadsworthii]
MDWAQIIKDIQEAGYSQKQIAEICGCSQGFISQVRNNYYSNQKSKTKRAVSFEVGTSLLDLHKKVTTEQ